MEQTTTRPIELWGGLECTVNRVRDDYFSQMERNGHATRSDDLERFASLGIRAIRYPVLWERTAPDGIATADWSWPDERLPGLQKLGVTPIVGLVHHGSGPRHTSLVDPGFAEQLAEFAGAVARRYPWVEYYTPVNEPLTTARFSGLYGVWYPHGRDERTFIQALLNQCRAVVLSMRAIREVNPAAKLVQTDDLGKSYGTPEMENLAGFYNERRWLSWDLLCGKVGPEHALWDYLTATGIDASEFLWFRDNPCPPDVIGINYYITSERWLDHRVDRYPPEFVGTYRDLHHADIHTARVLATPTPGIGPLLQEAWERYGLPLAVTEAHIDANREDQMRWLLEIWEAAQEAQRSGADVKAVTVWALLGSYDWNCLVTACKGYYEPGPFDVRTPRPRPTAVAGLMRELSAARPLSHPVLQGQGWWRRPGRFYCQPVATSAAIASLTVELQHGRKQVVQPILITGATGTLGRAFARICEARNLSYRLIGRQDMDIADPASVERALQHYQPWAIINAGGYVRVDEAEQDSERCFRENTLGPSVLAIACIRHNVQLMTFSSDLVFDGRQQAPYVESDNVSPLNIYGRSKVEAERRVLDTHPEALVVRTSAFFGPWDSHNFLTLALKTLAAGSAFVAANDVTVSPTYVPDLVHASLDLLIDREKGVWHLTNAQPITWADLALKACAMANVDPSRLEARPGSSLDYIAARPTYSALGTEKAVLLPALDDALMRYLRLQEQAAEEDASGAAAQVGNV
ncbi:family 1 glycosylhydrolase [Noviherbaspirillum sp. CPCC 100848]|uniref:dTDP-4-dehydrorhamnose reductase n=1 Tax=Noviherbaspirillum album TaxID=3080276 RepID=A0ABU6J9M3_9BURK|nr:family 1 glycosylhydrolase [Noviherbaspirillum sp. CPCC 100848]MEC4719982.1 family 1 glycosylhydrolase [Noviherbaspirillum sp. CPCC 100848]